MLMWMFQLNSLADIIRVMFTKYSMNQFMKHYDLETTNNIEQKFENYL